jgi:hypothetical protein
MMAAWVSSSLRPPPKHGRVTVRFGARFFDAGWSEWRGKWFELYPGRQEEIPDPPLWWDRDAPEISKEEERRLILGQEQTSVRRSRGDKQLDLFGASPDSEKLSSTRPRGAGEAA